MSAINRLFLVACTFIAVSAMSFSQDSYGQRLLGELAFGFSETNLGVGAAYVHPLDETFELAGEFTFFLPIDPYNLSDEYSYSWCFWMMMVNCYATFERIDGFSLYGIGGIGLTNSSFSSTYEPSDQVVAESSETEFGGQLGLGVNKIVGDDLLVHFELLIPVGGSNGWFGAIAQAGARVPVF